MVSRITSWPAGGAGLAIALALLVGLAGCQQPCVSHPASSGALARVCYPGPQSAAPIFSPVTASAANSSEPADLPPIETFNWRPDWPVVSGVRLPEVVFYSEYYYDRQGDHFWWSGFTGGDFRRTFRSFRSGLIIK